MDIELKDHICSKRVHPDLLLAEELIYKPPVLVLENLEIDDEHVDYRAAESSINNQSIKFLVGKITSKKIGQFVTFWKRIGKGPMPIIKLYCAKRGLYCRVEKKFRWRCESILLRIKRIILRRRKRMLGSYNILLNFLSKTLI